MTTMRMAVLVAAVVATALAGCGRKNAPVPVSETGERLPVVLSPGNRGLASAPTIVREGSGVTVPRETQRNPRAERRPFILDGLLD